MELIKDVTWSETVFPAWRRSANNAPRPNSDVWRPLPDGVRWHEAVIEPCDVAQLYLIGSGDLRETFGSYKLTEISRPDEGDDRFQHRSRVRGLIDCIRRGGHLEPPVAVGEGEEGPFVIVDGNHRCLARYTIGELIGTPIFLGIMPGLLGEYRWSRLALSAGRARFDYPHGERISFQ